MIYIRFMEDKIATKHHQLQKVCVWWGEGEGKDASSHEPDSSPFSLRH